MAAKRNDSILDVDIRRITLVGWVVVMMSAAIGLGCGYLVYENFDSIMERIGTGNPNERGKGIPVIILIVAITFSAAIVFAICAMLLRLLGLNVMHPRVSDEPEPTAGRNVFREDA